MAERHDEQKMRPDRKRQRTRPEGPPAAVSPQSAGGVRESGTRPLPEIQGLRLPWGQWGRQAEDVSEAVTTSGSCIWKQQPASQQGGVQPAAASERQGRGSGCGVEGPGAHRPAGPFAMKAHLLLSNERFGSKTAGNEKQEMTSSGFRLVGAGARGTCGPVFVVEDGFAGVNVSSEMSN